MQLLKKYLDVTDLVFKNVVVPLGKDFADVENIYFIIKKLPSDPSSQAKIFKKKSDGGIVVNGQDIEIKFSLVDYENILIGYNYVSGIVFKFTEIEGFNEDLSTNDLVFEYPSYFLGESVEEQIQDKTTLLDLLTSTMKVEKFIAIDGQTEFIVPGGKIDDNVFLNIQVEAEFWLAKNGVKGLDSGLITVDFATGKLTSDTPLSQGTPLIVTYTA